MWDKKNRWCGTKKYALFESLFFPFLPMAHTCTRSFISPKNISNKGNSFQYPHSNSQWNLLEVADYVKGFFLLKNKNRNKTHPQWNIKTKAWEKM